MSERISFTRIDQLNSAFLWEFLYQAIYVPPGQEAPPREIVRQPELARYVEGWGREGDVGLYAWINDSTTPVGAAWLRLWTGNERGYGWVGEGIPELSLAVMPDYRGQGLGQRLLAGLLGLARSKFAGVSLSVSRENPALRLYQRSGFREVSELDGTITMLLRTKDYHINEETK